MCIKLLQRCVFAKLWSRVDGFIAGGVEEMKELTVVETRGL
jgi:hypothetical protein